MKNYILLDWDGNLARTLDVWLHACRIPLEARGLELTDAEIASCFGAPRERFAEWGITDIDEILDEMDTLAAKALPEDTERHKPHPEPLQKALETLGATIQEAVMIGDSDKDLGAAANAGMDSILFYPPEHTKFYDLEHLKTLKPTHIVADFREIITLV